MQNALALPPAVSGPDAQRGRGQNSPRGAKPSGWRATHHNAGFSPFHALILPIVPQLSQPRVPKGFKRPRDIASPPVCKAHGVSTSARFHCVFPPPNSQSEPSGPERHRSLSPHAASTAALTGGAWTGPVCPRRGLFCLRGEPPPSTFSPAKSRRCLVYFVPVRTQRRSCGVLDLLLSTNQRTCSCLFEFLLGCIGFTDSRGAI